MKSKEEILYAYKDQTAKVFSDGIMERTYPASAVFAAMEEHADWFGMKLAKRRKKECSDYWELSEYGILTDVDINHFENTPNAEFNL